MAARAALRRLGLPAGVMLGLVGCAVMTIKVDVYKGPLANHEDVQVQQFAAMIIGARPLLIALRDRLQWPGDNERDCARGAPWYRDGIRLKPRRVTYRSKTNYYSKKEAFDPDGCNVNDGGDEIEWTEAAGRVNAVLSLYEDKGVPGLAGFLDDFDKAQAAYNKQQKILDSYPNADKELWNEIETGFEDEVAADTCPAKEQEGGTSDEKPRQSLFCEYKELLYPHGVSDGKWRDAKGLSNASGVKASTVSGILGVETDAYLFSPNNRKIDYRKLRTVEELRLLQDDKILEDHIDALFRSTDSAEAKKFRARVRELANAYFGARDQVRTMWRTALRMIGFIATADKEEIDDQTRKRLLDLTAELISVLTQPQHLALVMGLAMESGSEPGLWLTQLKETMQADSGSFWDDSLKCFKKMNEQVKCWNSGDFDVANQLVQDAFKRDPSGLADLFFKADTMLMRLRKLPLQERAESAEGGSAEDQSLRELADEQSLRELQEYGLARGPTFGDDELKFDDIQDTAKSIAAGAAVGLEEGRLDVGIVTLQEQYLDLLAEPASNLTANGCKAPDVCERHVKAVRDLLLDALVRFSEKLLVIANNNALIDPEHTKGTELNRYVLVLQAVGNSILIQANELRHREAHDKKLKERTGPEKQALARLFSRSTEKYVEDLLSGLKADAARAAERLAAARAEKEAAEKDREKAQKKVASVQTERDTAKTKSEDAQKALKSKEVEVAPILAAHAILNGEFKDQIRTAAETASPVDGPRMVAAITAWLEGKIGAIHDAVKDHADTKRMKSAKEYFDKKKNKVDCIKSGDMAKDIAAIDGVFRDDREKAEETIKELEGTLAKAKKDFDDKVEKFKVAEQSLERARAAVRDATDRLNFAKETTEKLDDAVAMVGDYKDEVVNSVRAEQVPVKPSVWHGHLVAVLEEARKKAEAEPDGSSGNDEKPSEVKLKNAIEVVRERTPAIDPADFDESWFAKVADDSDPKHPNARDVLDTLIAALRHEHIEAVHEAGADAGRAPHIAAALKVAYEQRAGMAYIRPSAAYLRSSYPSTSLQDDPNLAWRNMLGDHALRSVPILGGVFANPRSEAEQRKIVSEIDKQFWQTINQVRVAGAGDTNYAIAKDDIGNWYVKAFSADPKDIIMSAQKLALFNIGAGLDTNLLSRLDGAQGQQPQDVSKPALQRLFEEFESDYAEKTKKDFEDLQKSIAEAGLETRIKAAWAGIKDVETHFKRSDIESDLSTTFGALQETEFTETKAADQSTKILAAAEAILRFHGALARIIRERQLAVQPKVELGLKEDMLEKAQAALKEEQDKLAQKQAERDAAHEIVQDKLRAEELDREGFDEAQENLEKKEKEVQALEGKVAEAKTAVQEAEAAVATAKENLKKVEDAERAALSALRRVVRDELTGLATRRNETVKTFETGIFFIGKATKPAVASQSEEPAASAAALADTTNGP